MTTPRVEASEAASAVDRRIALLDKMLEIRLFEEAVHRVFAEGLIRGSTHLCHGQEAVSVGACFALAPGDSMTCTYRGHGAVLAMGAPLEATFAEILGRAGGLCGGKGGSMHLTHVESGAYGSFAIVGGHLPIANGLAFAARYKRTEAVSLCFFGDGSTNIGAFHEALNLAALWSLPVVFVIENNLYGEYSPIRSTTPIDDLYLRAAAFGMVGAKVDGNDVELVHETVGDAVAKARAGGGPTLIEAKTYRQVGHSRADPARYRPEDELEEWLARDPIALLEGRLGAPATVRDLRESVEARVAAAFDAAVTQPEPEPRERFDNVLWDR